MYFKHFFRVIIPLVAVLIGHEWVAIRLEFGISHFRFRKGRRTQGNQKTFVFDT